MSFQSSLAIYILFWTICLFVVLPFGMRTAEEEGAKAGTGHAESAPHVFRFGRVMWRTSLLAAILFAIFYLNYVFGWISADDVDFTRWGRSR